MLAARRRQDGLVVDAGIRHAHAEPGECGNGAALQFQHPVFVPEERCLFEVGAPWIRDGGYPHATFVCIGQPLQPHHARLAETFRIRHDVGLGHGDKIFGAKELAYLDLVFDRGPCNDAQLAGKHCFFFVI